MTVVLDASVAIDALLPSPRHDAALRQLQGSELYAPDIVDVEVLSAIARLELASTIAAPRADQAVADWKVLRLTRIAGELLIPEVWTDRYRLRISAGCYVAAARGLEVPLVTADARLARAPIQGVTVTLVQ